MQTVSFSKSENDMVCNLFCELADDVLERHKVVTVSSNEKKNNTVLYTLSIEKLGDREEIIYRFPYFKPQPYPPHTA